LRVAVYFWLESEENELGSFVTFWKELSFKLSERDYFLTQTEDKLGIESIKERNGIQKMYDLEFQEKWNK